MSIVFFGVLPLAGLLAELLTGLLSLELSLFPSWWHVAAVVIAVVLNLLLHRGLWNGSRHLVARAIAIGFVAGMALLYAVAEAPAVPLMVFLAFFGIGILAMAPYFACCGLLRLVPSLVRDWRASGRSMPALAFLLTLLAVTPTANELWQTYQEHKEQHELVQLAAAMRDVTRDDEAERLAEALRRGDREAQRVFCAFGVDGRRSSGIGFDDDDRPFRRALGDGRFAHLADGAPFWFDRLFHQRHLAADDARLAFHRVHGVGWNDGDEPIDRFGWRGGRDNEWLSSRIEVRAEPDAALAQVDWQLEVRSHGNALAEARFDLRLPPLAEATSLSSWIDGQERPAAFGGSAVVQGAYDAVVAKKRDPALLQELAPGSMRLLLFPLQRDLPPMRVRIGFTVPLRLVGSATELWLPRVDAHTCLHARVAQHELVLASANGPERRFVGDDELAQPIALPRGASVAQARDADGVVVQRLVPRAASAQKGPFVVVLDASATVAETVPQLAEVIEVFPAGVDVVAFVAHGTRNLRCEGKARSVELARALAATPCAGGVDARSALQAACDEAKRLGVSTVHWLHGAAAASQPRPWPTFPEGVQVAAFALHPGRNVVLEGLQREPALHNLSRFGDTNGWRAALAETLAYDASQRAFGDHARVFERHATPLDDVPVVSDHIARLWAAGTARTQRTTDPVGAAKLAARYRVVTAGVGAIVLETKAQYDAAGLDPGAPVGREPAGPVGGAATPEPSTWLMLASGLLVVGWWQRRRARGETVQPAA